MAGFWFVAFGLGAGLVLFGRPRRLRRRSGSPQGIVRIVIPARNESRSLPNLLSDLRDAGGDWDIVVVDDQSTDDTAALARSSGVARVIDAPPPPAGWRGKPWACAVGSSDRHGPAPDVLLFLDADVRVAPGAVESLLLEREEHGGVVSVQPFHRAPSLVEQLSAPFNVVSMMGIGADTAHPHGMFGPVICCRRDDYVAIGGHAAVRDSVIEDVALARRFRSAGTPVAVLAGGAGFEFRMYPEGLLSLIEGWTKNMAAGAGSIPLWRTVGVAWWIAALLSASAFPLAVVTGASTWTGAVTYLAAAGSSWSLFRRVGDFRWWVAAAFPLAMVVFVAVFLRSAWMTHIRRSVTWRGRTIDLTTTDRHIPSQAAPPGSAP